MDAPEVPRLRELVREYDELVRRRDALERERVALMQSARPPRLEARHRPAAPALTAGVRTPDPGPRPKAATSFSAELEAIPVRNLLLGTGAALLGLAALIFAFIAWPRLGEGGQALVLLATTVVAAGTAWALRVRLPATAEALTAVTISLVLVDAYALREAGIGASTLTTSQYWAITTAVLAVGGVLLGRVSRVAAVAAALAGPLAAVLAADSFVEGPLGWSAALSVIAASGIGAAIFVDDATTSPASMPARALTGVALLLWLAACFSAISVPGPESLSLAAVILLTALAPLVVAMFSLDQSSLSEWRRAGAVAMTLCVLAAVGVGATALGAGAWAPVVVAAAAALFSAASLVRADARLMAAGVSGLAVLTGVVLYFAESWITPALGPLEWFDQPWALAAWDPATLPVEPPIPLQVGETLVVLAIAAAVMAGGAFARRDETAGSVLAGVTGGLAAAAIAVAVLAAHLPVGLAVGSLAAAAALALALSGIADRGAGRVPVVGLLVAAGVLAAPALGWTAASRAVTPALPLALALGGGAAAALGRSDWLRQSAFGLLAAALMALPPAVVAATVFSDTGRAAGLALTISAAAIVIAGSLGRGRPVVGSGLVEGVGLAGLLVGVSLAADDSAALALALTLATAALLAAGGLPTERRDPYLLAGATGAVVATWAWLGVANVELPDAYILPAAAVALLVGLEARRRHPDASSWTTVGPGLLIGFAPSVVMALSAGGWTRPVLVTVAAMATVIIGSATKLQAPLAIGSSVILLLGIDAIAPALGATPRWASIGAAGLILLWLGATAERRLADLREWRGKYDSLESRPAPPTLPS